MYRAQAKNPVSTRCQVVHLPPTFCGGHVPQGAHLGGSRISIVSVGARRVATPDARRVGRLVLDRAARRRLRGGGGRVAVQLQAATRGHGTRMALQRHALEEQAVMRVQATIRGNAARGIAERRRLAEAPRRLVHREHRA